MISGNIDLTEHNDFSTPEIPISINTIIAREASRLYSANNINSYDFHIIEIFERVFGKTLYNVNADLFHLEDYYKRWGICECCGGKIIPWKNHSPFTNVCRKCDTVQKASIIPWVHTLNQQLPLEIFNLR